ncbi:MAG: DUF2066 domain-containing protein [Lysobacterales bacterium]|jgi:hypothetical protein|nr:MAG: DUF2066 domain-containing protein [Xanthomonadales bacterium]
MRRAFRSLQQTRSAWAALSLALACLLAWPAAGAAALRLHEVTVPLAGKTEADRAAAFSAALRTVVVRVSGRRAAATNRTVAAADPTRHVQRYSTTADGQLKVGFDGRSIEQLLQQAGLPVWPRERPVTTIDAAESDRSELQRAADARGLPVAFAGGAGGGGATVLAGRRVGAQYEWTFRHAGEAVTATGTAETGVDLAADTLAARYAPESTRSTNAVTIRVAGMQRLDAYSGLLAYLDSLSLVRSIDVESLERDVVQLRLAVRGDRTLLDRIVALDTRLQAVAETGDGTPAGVDFLYVP